MLKNRKVAMLICVIVVALSILGGARRSISEAIAETESAFVYGVDGDGKSIYHDLRTRVQLANNLATVAERYLGAEDDLVVTVRTDAKRLEKETSPSRCYALNQALDRSVSDLNAALLNEPLSEADEGYRSGIMTDMTSYAYIISHDGYNELVRELNEETLAKFPASILKYLTFTGNAEYYG